MIQPPPFIRNFKLVLIPTRFQIGAALVLAWLILVFTQIHDILAKFGIGQAAVDLARTELTGQFGGILRSAITANLTLVTFWATVGLIAYLVCWAAYNAVIEARNQVTLETQYKNRQHYFGRWETLGMKTGAGVLLVIYLVLFKYGFMLWLGLSAAFVADSNIGYFLISLLAWAGLAAQLYGLLVLLQLTFTAWYQLDAFTDPTA